jgi:hypothetical protein
MIALTFKGCAVGLSKDHGEFLTIQVGDGALRRPFGGIRKTAAQWARRSGSRSATKAKKLRNAANRRFRV